MECFHLTTLKTDWKEQLFKPCGIHGDQADSVIQMEKQMLSVLEKFPWNYGKHTFCNSRTSSRKGKRGRV